MHHLPRLAIQPQPIFVSTKDEQVAILILDRSVQEGYYNNTTLIIEVNDLDCIIENTSLNVRVYTISILKLPKHLMAPHVFYCLYLRMVVVTM